MKKDSLLHSVLFSKLMIALAAALIFGAISVVALRNNYSTMVELRQAVVVADEQNGDIEGALQALREHVHRHMNTNLSSGANPIKPPIQLKSRYERLMAAERERVKTLNAEVTREAEAICSKRFPGAGFNSPRVACITDYVADNAAKENSIPEDLYKFDFVSPRWSPDIAGLSIIVTVIAILIFIFGVGIAVVKQRLS